jgi:arylsulfatase A-like enzyme
MTVLYDAIGRVLKTVDDLGLDKNTLMFLISDNGGGFDERTGGNAASNGPLRGGIMMCYAGGIRVPAMARWSGHIPATSVSDAQLWSMDLLSTFISSAGAALPADRRLDDIDFGPALAGQPAPRRDLFTAPLHTPC